MSEGCVFCRIIAGEIPGDFVYQDEEMVAFRDINPVAPTHLLLVPREHIEAVHGLPRKHGGLVGRMMLRAGTLAEQEGIADGGYRLVINSGRDGRQLVPHLHLHLVGGRKLSNAIG